MSTEKIIVIMEALGMLLVSAGVGGVASWYFGVAGACLATGLALLGFATLVAWRQKAMMNNSAGGKQ